MNAFQTNPKRAEWALWLSRAVAVALIPLLSFGALELGLRLFGYGYPAGLFVKIEGRDAYTTNPRFGWRFFSPEIARRPEPCILPARKAPDTFRIFVLGESAAMGTPEPAFSFGRILEVMLRDQYPGIRFEVVNAAMTAVNSHAILPIARDCAGRDGDLFVVYMGNNEVVGPYGAGTIFQPYSPSLALIRAGVWARSTRTGQLVEDLMRWFVKRDRAFTEWRGMEMFLDHQVPAADPRLEKVYQHFQKNLADVCEVASRGGAGVLVCTVATNLKDNAPFASAHRPGLTPSDLAEWEKLYRRGIALAESGQHAGAVEAFLKAADLDDQSADLHFRLARSCLTLGLFDKAREHFIQARDLDALRFRADTRINEVVRQVAGNREGEGIFLVDAERAFEGEEGASHAIPGQEQFYEHVHLNFNGNYLLARAVFERTTRILQAKSRDQAPRAVTTPSRDLCQELVALTDWNRHRMQAQMAEMMDRPPFTHQSDYEQGRLQRYRALRTFRLKHAYPAALRKAQAHRAYLKAVERNPDDLSFRQGLIGLLQERREYDAAAAHCRALLERIPDNPWFHGGLGDILNLQGRYGEAIAEYREMQRLAPGLAAPCIHIGTALAKQGRFSEAAAELRRALEIDPGSKDARNQLGEVLVAQGRLEDARKLLIAGLQPAQDHRDRRNEAFFLGKVGGLYLRQGKFKDALESYRSALDVARAAQDYRGMADFFANMGNAYSALEDLEEALKSYNSGLNLYREMDDLAGQGDVLSGLGIVHFKRGDMDEALRAFTEALEDQRELDDLPGQANALSNIGDVYFKKEDWDRALASYGEALKIRRGLGDLSGQAFALSVIGNAYIGKKELDEALKSHAQALDLYKKIGNPLGQANALSNIGLCYAKQGRTPEAFDLLMQARSLYLRLGVGGASLQAVEGVISRLQQGQ